MIGFLFSRSKQQGNKFFMRILFRRGSRLILPKCLKREDSCDQLKYLDAVLGGAGNRYEDAFSAVKLYLAEAVLFRVFIGYDLAHAGLILAKMEITFKFRMRQTRAEEGEGSVVSARCG